MQLAQVIGDVVATIKDANLTGHKLLLVSRSADRQSGGPVVALDAVGAGVGEHVFLCWPRSVVPVLPCRTTH